MNNIENEDKTIINENKEEELILKHSTLNNIKPDYISNVDHLSNETVNQIMTKYKDM